MTHPSHGTDFAKSVKNFTGRRSWPGDHLRQISEITGQTHHRICHFDLRRKRQATPAPNETSSTKLLPTPAVTYNPY